MNTLKKYIFCLNIIFLLTSCQSGWLQPRQDVEIVYQTGYYSQKEIGFINADGSNLKILKVGDYFRRPVWSSNGDLIYGIAGGLSNGVAGYPAYWNKDGKFKMCRNWGYIFQIEGTGDDNNKIVLISDYRTIWVVNLEKCEKIEKLVDLSNRVDVTIEGFSYFPKNQELVYGFMITDSKTLEQVSRIIKKDLKTRIEEEMADGCSPSWSPDGTQIAYVGKDGIFSIDADGTNQHQIIKHQFTDIRTNRYGGAVIPVPRWSPDGKWIIYHRCEEYACFVNENAIYRVSIFDGEELKIIYGGGYPSWKPKSTVLP